MIVIDIARGNLVVPTPHLEINLRELKKGKWRTSYIHSSVVSDSAAQYYEILTCSFIIRDLMTMTLYSLFFLHVLLITFLNDCMLVSQMLCHNTLFCSCTSKHTTIHTESESER